LLGRKERSNGALLPSWRHSGIARAQATFFRVRRLVKVFVIACPDEHTRQHKNREANRQQQHDFPSTPNNNQKYSTQ
jgi:hypothetical protein